MSIPLTGTNDILTGMFTDILLISFPLNQTLRSLKIFIKKKKKKAFSGGVANENKDNKPIFMFSWKHQVMPQMK